MDGGKQSPVMVHEEGGVDGLRTVAAVPGKVTAQCGVGWRGGTVRLELATVANVAAAFRQWIGEEERSTGCGKAWRCRRRWLHGAAVALVAARCDWRRRICRRRRVQGEMVVPVVEGKNGVVAGGVFF